MNSAKPTASPITKIDKRSNLSQKELFKEYIEPEIPVVLTDATKDWEAIGKITPEFFKKNYPDITKEIDGVTYKMSDFIDLMLASTPEKVAPYPYNFNVQNYFPELLKYMKPEILYAKSDRVNHKLVPKFMFGNTHVYEIFLGGNGAKWYTLHIDALCMHTQITQLYGAKTFFLYSPDQTPYLYPDPEQSKQSLINVFAPDYKKFPLFKHAKSVQVTVEEGETILFPKGWWHTTEMNGPSISLGRVQLNAANWKDFCDDNYDIWKKKNRKMRVPVYLYSRALGQLMDVQEKLGWR
jgi:histone arginine demethylase JMJD6